MWAKSWEPWPCRTASFSEHASSIAVAVDGKTMSGIQTVVAVSSVGLFEPPLVIPGFDKIVLKLLLIVSIILVTCAVVTISSIVGVIRAARRLRRGGHSKASVVLAVVATAIAASWLAYWTGEDIYHRSNPINGLLAINLVFCLPPLSWLIAAIHANATRRTEAK